MIVVYVGTWRDPLLLLLLLLLLMRLLLLQLELLMVLYRMRHHLRRNLPADVVMGRLLLLLWSKLMRSCRLRGLLGTRG